MTAVPTKGATQGSLSESSKPEEQAEQTTDALTSLLIGMTKSEVQDLRASVHGEDEFAGRVGAVLGEAMELADADPRLQLSLGTAAKRGVLEIARRQPDKLGDAIAPAMGPAIRGMVALALSDLNERVDSIIQQSFSFQGLKWRFESYRTGTSLSELVLRDTLTYRVEHALLIHRSSGTLLNHAMQPEYKGKDPAVVAAMLTAVKQFLEDAFSEPASNQSEASEETTIEEVSHQFSAGDSSILIKAGGELALAAVVRGTQTAHLQQRLSESLQLLLETYGQKALNFDGSVDPYSGALTLLEDCLHKEEAKSDVDEAEPDGASAMATAKNSAAFKKVRKQAPVIALLLAGVAWWGYQSYTERQNWDNFINRLNEQPGLTITTAKRTGEASATIRGLRDPDAIDVFALAQEFGYSDLSLDLQSFLSLNPAVTMARAQRILEPPKGINLRLGNGVLRVTGRSDDRWLNDISTLSVPGVVRINTTKVLPKAP